MFGIRFGSKKFLGIDIGTSSIRLVELSKRGRALKLENYGEFFTPFFDSESIINSKKDALLLSNEDIGRIIRAVSKESGVKTKEVNFSIPDFRSFFTSFRMPVMAKKELSEAIRYEVRPYIPLPLSEITLDWLITEGEPSKTALKVLVVAIPNEIIDQYREIAELAGLKLKALESEVFALARASCPLKRNRNNKNNSKRTKEAKEEKGETKEAENRGVIGVIDIGTRTSTCSIVESGILKTSHSFSVAGSQLVERLATSLNIDYNKSKEMIEKQGLSAENIGKVLNPLVYSFVLDIKNTFQSFYQAEGKEVAKVILAGGFSLIPGFKDYFSSQLNKETVISNPFSDISYPQILKNDLEKMGPSYAIAVGLAMKGLE